MNSLTMQWGKQRITLTRSDLAAAAAESERYRLIPDSGIKCYFKVCILMKILAQNTQVLVARLFFKIQKLWIT